MRQWEIQQAIYDDLTASEQLMERIEGVFDHVPQNTKYPYVVIGEDTGLQWDTDTSDGVNSTITVHVWSRERGRKETKEIMDIIHRVLHRSELNISTLTSVFCYWEFSESFMDTDGKTRHGVTRFRILAEEEIS